jgi:hypothetical protein
VPLQGGEERILALAASVEADGCVIGASDGSLFFLEGSSEPGCISNVGSFDAAILALSWSPDGEVLAIATASGVVFASTGSIACIRSNLCLSGWGGLACCC